jgi:hypothetical protein
MNPFDWATPSLGPFAPILQSKIGMLLGVAWALAFVYCAYWMVVNIAKMARARQGGLADNLEEARTGLFWSGGATVGLVIVPLVYGVLVAS